MKKYIAILAILFLSTGMFVGFYKGIEYLMSLDIPVEEEKQPPVYKVNTVNILNISEDMVSDLTLESHAEELIPVIKDTPDEIEILDTNESSESTAEIDATAEEPITETEADSPEAISEEDIELDVESVETETKNPVPEGLVEMIVTEDARVLNIRKEPNTSSKIVKTLKSGEIVWVYEDIMEEGFYKLYTESNQDQWAFSSFLKKVP